MGYFGSAMPDPSHHAASSLAGSGAHESARKAPGLSISGLFRALRRRWLLATTLGVLLSVAAGTATWFGMPVKYTASTLLHVSLKEPKILGGDSQSPAEFSSYQKTQAALITSRMTLNSVLKKGDIAHLDTLPRQPDQQIEWLQKELQIDFKTGPEFMRISIAGDRPEELTTLLNAVTEVYLREVVNKERTQKVERLNHLKVIQEKFDSTLRERREAVRKLVLAVGSSDPQAIAIKQRFAAEALAASEKELHQIQLDIPRLQVELKAKVSRENAADQVEIPESQIDRFVDKDPDILKLLAKKEQLEKLIADGEKRAVRGKQEPALRPYADALATAEKDLQRKRADLRLVAKEQLRGQVAGDLKVAVAGLNERLELLQELERSRAADVERWAKQSKTTNVGQADIEEYKLEIAQTEKMADRVGAEVESLKLEVDAPRRVELREEAYASKAAMERQRLKATGAAALIGLVLAVGLVSWREYRWHRVDGANEFAAGLGMPVVGTLPPVPSTNPSMLPWRKSEAVNWQNILTEHIDVARTNLLHSAQARGIRVVMVTSALSGEGKTSLSCHLAASLARGGYKTLLIDGDLRQPTAHRVFNMTAGQGLSELLRAEVEFDQCVLPTGIGNLSLLLAGEWDQRATQALARSQLPTLLQTLRERYEYIVIDTSPVLPVVDTLLLGQHVDGVILSLLHEVSQLPLVHTAIERLGSVGARMLGVVMNGAPVGAYAYRYGNGPTADYDLNSTTAPANASAAE